MSQDCLLATLLAIVLIILSSKSAHCMDEHHKPTEQHIIEQVNAAATLLSQRPKLSRIIGGQNAPDGRYPYGQISLQLPNNDHQCGASLIASDIILTAAHCKGWYDRVHINQYDFSDPHDAYDTYTPIIIVVHPDFDLTKYRYDFSVVKLDRRVDNVRPVALISNSTVLADGEALTVMGWGATEKDASSSQYPSIIHRAYVQYESNDACMATEVFDELPYEGEIYPEMLCAGDKGVDACLGDSGGPLVIEGATAADDVQVGLVSWGRGCAVLPGVYSRISYEYEWIRQQVCELSDDPPSSFDCARATHSPTVSPDQYVADNSPTVVAQGTVVTNMIDVNVQIQLDQSSNETGWFIANDAGDKVIERRPGYYILSNYLVREIVSLQLNQVYIFVLEDTGGNGIMNGSYRLFVHHDGNLTVLASGSGSFDTRLEQAFFVNDNAIQQANAATDDSMPSIDSTTFKLQQQSSSATTATGTSNDANANSNDSLYSATGSDNKIAMSQSGITSNAYTVVTTLTQLVTAAATSLILTYCLTLW